MAWCHQAPNHYPGQCWPISMSPCGVTWPQWHLLVRKVTKIITSQRNVEGNMSSFVVSTVLSDGPLLLNARPSAGTVITKSESYKCVQEWYLNGWMCTSYTTRFLWFEFTCFMLKNMHLARNAITVSSYTTHIGSYCKPISPSMFQLQPQKG